MESLELKLTRLANLLELSYPGMYSFARRKCRFRRVEIESSSFRSAQPTIGCCLCLMKNVDRFPRISRAKTVGILQCHEQFRANFI